MRKQNSKFRSLYLSKPGTQLFNNDFYASAEADKFACYVVVDALGDGDNEDVGARIAAEVVIDSFNQHPSMSKMSLYSYIQKAHIALGTNSGKKDLMASITVVVTDYQKVRFAYLGNTRFALFRKGALHTYSQDHSLSWEMMEEGELPRDKIAQHEERDNLSRYLGRHRFTHPQISKKIKLVDGDIMALYTSGTWACCDENDLLAELTAAGDDAPQALENVERVLLDGAPDPDEIENYTIGFIYVDKVYLDPERGKRRKKILKIVLIIAIILLIIGIILFFWLRSRRIKREDMETAYTSGIGYIQDENYLRAKTELDTAYQLAEALRDKSRMTDIDEFRKMVEQVINADDLLESGDFNDAQAAYLRAQSRSRYTDNVAMQYVGRRLEETSGYLNVHDYITLGDTLTDQSNYASAEDKYLQARRLASQIYYSDGKQQALDALENLYEKMQAEVDAANDQAGAEIVAADYIVQGDNAVKENDLTAAELYYTLAKEQYSELGNETVLASIEEKMAALANKRSEIASLIASAENFVQQGDALMAKKQYAEAKRQYILARSIYSDQNDQENIDLVQDKVDAAEAGVQKLAEEERVRRNADLWTEHGERA